MACDITVLGLRHLKKKKSKLEPVIECLIVPVVQIKAFVLRRKRSCSAYACVKLSFINMFFPNENKSSSLTYI